MERMGSGIRFMMNGNAPLYSGKPDPEFKEQEGRV